MRKFISLLLALVMVFSLTITANAEDVVIAPAPAKDNDIVVLFTNDVHCGVDDTIGYAGLAAYKAEMEAAHNYVTLVDCGDAVQGAPIGTVSKGSYLVDIMNKVGYDYATFGNHEFDYTMPNLKALVKQAEYQYLSCNFNYLGTDSTNAVDVPAYAIETYGDTKVAFVGITTPESFTKSTPTYFQNEKGEYVYSFAEGNNGADLYAAVQKAVDAAKAEGAKYVVALAHLGIEGTTAGWTSTDVIANTTGIDVMLDGHSHETYNTTAASKDGKAVTLVQTYTKLENIGKLTIAADGTITAELVNGYTEKNAAVDAYVKDIQSKYQAYVDTVVAKSNYEICINNAAGNRIVRSSETNAGDLCADAYRLMMKADIGLMNGGGVRATVKAGDITRGDIMTIMPFGNLPCVVEATGAQILDALELGASKYPAENGGFLHVSGLRYTINGTVASSVQLNDKGEFVSVDGARRVSDVKVLNAKTGVYENLQADKTYTVASHNYMLVSGGDGFAMWKGCKVVTEPDENYLDNTMLVEYIEKYLNGVVGSSYANRYGDGRITIYPTKFTDVLATNTFATAIKYVTDNGYFTGKTETLFNVKGNVTRGQLAAVLYRMAGSPAVTGENKFSDVAAGKYYTDAVIWAAENGIVGGYTDGTFRPTKDITRAQLAKMLWNYAQFMKVDVSVGEETNILSYEDALTLKETYIPAMQWACGAGIVNGNGGYLNHGNSATRGQVAAMLYRYCTAAAAVEAAA